MITPFPSGNQGLLRPARKVPDFNCRMIAIWLSITRRRVPFGLLLHTERMWVPFKLATLRWVFCVWPMIEPNSVWIPFIKGFNNSVITRTCNMADTTQHWVINKAQNRIYNSAAPSKCLSSHGSDMRMRMLDCSSTGVNWVVRERGGISSPSNPQGSYLTLGFG